jgi:CheY-like chemotaxis protein
MTVLRVLHVDDEHDIREVVEMSLGLDSSFVTRTCGSGEDAIGICSDWSPDVILMDVMMPEMDGPATLLRLQQNLRTKSIPVVFMTARAQARELDRFLALGAVGVIPKPFDPMTLAALVRSHLPEADAMEPLRASFLERVGRDIIALSRLRAAFDRRVDMASTLAGIKHIAHGLAGSGGIFGFSEISNASAALEEAAIAELKCPGSGDAITSAYDFLILRAGGKHVANV